MKKRTYSEMKNSGVEWIGEIPKEWKVSKGKHLFRQRNSRGNDRNLELLSPTQRFGVIPQILYEQLTCMRATKLKVDTDLNELKTIYAGDFCISLRSFQGGFEYSKYDGVVSPAYQIFYAREILVDNYYKFLFKNEVFISKISSITSGLRDGKNIAYSDFECVELPFPPFPEQTAIANYLDAKCAQIDEIISETKKCIEEYKQWKSAAIFKAVTKGLDPNAEMKDSGVEWIGEIPKEWEIIKIKKIILQRDGGAWGKEPKGDKLDRICMRVADLAFEQGMFKKYENDLHYTKRNYSEQLIEKLTLNNGDILLEKSGGGEKKPVGRVGMYNLPFQVLFSNFLDRLRIRLSKVSPKFVVYYWQAMYYKTVVVKYIKQTTGIQNLNTTSILEKEHVLVPNLSEQNAIADYLDNKCAQIDEIISEKEALISDLESYKKSLMYEVVTGKIRVS